MGHDGLPVAAGLADPGPGCPKRGRRYRPRPSRAGARGPGAGWGWGRPAPTVESHADDCRLRRDPRAVRPWIVGRAVPRGRSITPNAQGRPPPHRRRPPLAPTRTGPPASPRRARSPAHPPRAAAPALATLRLHSALVGRPGRCWTPLTLAPCPCPSTGRSGNYKAERGSERSERG